MITFDLPKNQSSIIKVIGVGGGGSNAVSHMYNQGIRGVDFIVCNTDAQAMEVSPIPIKIQLGKKGLGAGSIPSVGKESAMENIEDLRAILEKNTKMVFITAGMGGGTGTGAAPVIAAVAKELGILTVGIVTIPFSFEGRKRRLQANQGIEELRANVDTLLVVSNDKLRELHGDLKLSQAFHQADNILTTAAKGIAEIVTVTGYINVDFEDVKTVMENSGKAIMGSATAEGETRAIDAVRMAMSSPLLDDNEIIGASNILLYITSGTEEISMDEVTEITDYIQDEAGQNAEIIWGNGVDESLGNKIGVTLVATGFNAKHKDLSRENLTIHSLNDEVSVKPTIKIDPKVEEEEVGEIQLIREVENRNTQPQKQTTDVKTKEDQRSIVFDLSSPIIDKSPNEPPQKIEMNEPTLMKRPEPRSENINSSFMRIEPQKKTYEVEDDKADLERRSNDRIQKLQELSIKLKTPEDLEKMEKQPAYLRRRVELSDTQASDESLISKFTLSDSKNEGATLRENNSFLHENVD